MYPDDCDSTRGRICSTNMGREREVRETVGKQYIGQQLRKYQDTSDKGSRAELGMYSLKTYKRHEEAQMAIQSKEHAKEEVARQS